MTRLPKIASVAVSETSQVTSRSAWKSGCRDAASTVAPSRRGFLRAGMLGFAGLSLADLLRHEAIAAPAASSKRANSVIILWMRGGPSHIDMWDPKPDAPLEYRGEFGTID